MHLLHFCKICLKWSIFFLSSLFLTSHGRDGNFGSLNLQMNPLTSPGSFTTNPTCKLNICPSGSFLCFACSHFPRVVQSATSCCHAQCVGQRDMEGGGWAPKRLRGDDIMDTWWARKQSWTNFGQNILSRRVLPLARLGCLNIWNFDISDSFWLV